MSLHNFSRLNVADNNAGRRGRDGSKDFAVLLDIDDGGAWWTNGRSGRSGGESVGEGYFAEVGKCHQATVLLVILYNPLSVLFTKRGRAGERLGDSLSCGLVGNDGWAGFGGGGGDSEGDGVSCRDGDAREVVGVVRVPFIPSCINLY